MNSDFEDRCFFEEEVWPHHDYIQKFIYTLTKNDALSKEIAQETMVSAWRNIKRVRTYKNLIGALRQMSQNNLVSRYRKNRIMLNSLGKLENFEEVPVFSNITCSIDNQSTVHDLLFLFNEVNPKHLRVVILRDYYGMTLKEVAQFMGINYNTAASYHKRAMKQMRTKVKGTEFFRDWKGGLPCD